MALCKQNVRAVCPKYKLEFNVSLSPDVAGVTNKQSVGLLGLEKGWCLYNPKGYMTTRTGMKPGRVSPKHLANNGALVRQ